jgi:hypothetical protein
MGTEMTDIEKVDVEEFARMAGVTTRTVNNWVRGGFAPQPLPRKGKTTKRVWVRSLIVEFVAWNEGIKLLERLGLHVRYRRWLNKGLETRQAALQGSREVAA